ncbi:hypothetical protein ACB092_04G052400 [Castanea dentata]
MSRFEQGLSFFKQFLAVFGFSFSFLLALVGLKYQNSNGALFQEHGVIMVLLIIDVCTGAIALAMVTLPNSHNSSLLLVEFVCLICGAIACDLLILILVPPFGWFMFIICAFDTCHHLIKFSVLDALDLNQVQKRVLNSKLENPYASPETLISQYISIASS